MLAAIRAFFAQRDVLEVETPILSRAATTDPSLASLSTVRCAPGAPDGETLYLHTSPEYPMKRLLAAGSGPIYQICKVFRDGERGRLHHPEFSLLEWYRPGWDSERLMGEVADLVRRVLGRSDLGVERIAYRDLFVDRLALDPWTARIDELRGAACARGVRGAHRLDLDVDGWLDLLLTHLLEPSLGRGCMSFLYAYPPTQAALARISSGDPPVAERFELYIDGIELANGFHELTDAAEQRRRLREDNARRRALALPVMPVDEAFLGALESGLPDAAGVALGLDRLLMVATGAPRIDAVIAFPVESA